MSCSAYYVGGPDKKQRRDRIISNFTKGGTFHLLRQSSALGANLTMWPPFLHPPKKPFSPLHFGQEENIPGHLTERTTY